MPDQQVFEYAVIRVVPRVEREEFLNIGVILYCAKKQFLACRFQPDVSKLELLCAKLDMDELQEHIQAFQKVCNGEKDGGPIARLDAASRFRWLTATRSTILQSSRVHPGLSDDPSASLQRIFEQQVL